MNKIILGLDLDGCLYDYHSALYTFCQYEMNYGGSYEEFWMDYIQRASKEKQEYLIGLPIPYETQIPPKSVMDFLDFIKENADDIYYITRRPIELERITANYLKRYNFPRYNNLFVTEDKCTTCRYLGITHFLDDQVKYIESVNGIADCYLMAKPWNREFRDDYKTVYSLREFQEQVFN